MKRSKLLALLLSSLLAISLFTGCSGETPSDSSTSNADNHSSSSLSDETTDGTSSSPEAGEVSLPIVEEPLTITWFMGSNSSLTALVDNLNETPFFQELEKRTNIHIDFHHPATGNESTAYNLLFASGDLPDLVTHTSPGYPGGLDACIDDGYILDLTELVPQYCPNYMAALNQFAENYDENVLRSAYTGKGRIGAVGGLMQELQGPWAGLYVREDWLEACGLDTPETFDDWEEMLTAFKEKMGATAPMLLYKNGYDNLSLVEISSFFPIDCVLPQLHSSCGSTFLIAFCDIKQLLPVTCKKQIWTNYR